MSLNNIKVSDLTRLQGLFIWSGFALTQSQRLKATGNSEERADQHFQIFTFFTFSHFSFCYRGRWSLGIRYSPG